MEVSKMSKYKFLKEAIEILQPNADEIIKRVTKKFDLEKFLSVISKNTYSIKDDLKIQSEVSNRLYQELFPDRSKGIWHNSKICTYIAGILEYKWCAHCSEFKPFEDFSKNSSRKLGLNAYCKPCHVGTTADTQAARQAKYKASKLDRTPKWLTSLDYEEIGRFYQNCPPEYQVDHIIPLQGELVSGLHCRENLQYLPSFDNGSKHNKYIIE